MKKLILTTLLMSIAILSISANEQASTIDKLKAHKWKIIRQDSADVDAFDSIGSFMEFNDTIMITVSKTKTENKDYYDSFIYYLSDVPDTEFDRGKVGKTKNGAYIVCQTTLGEFKHPVVYQIMELKGVSVILKVHNTSRYSKYVPYQGPAFDSFFPERHGRKGLFW